MTDIHQMVDTISDWADAFRATAVGAYLPSPTWTAVLLLALGVILAVRGARLLRTIYVIAFMIGGAAAGIRVAEGQQVDLLIGLVLGAGIAALVGNLLFRWWVGVTSGAFALVVLMAFAGPRVWPAEFEAFKIHQAELAERSPEMAVSVMPDGQPQAPSWDELSAYFWGERKDLAVKALVIAGLTFVLGLGVGLIMPRLTVVLGTSFVGVLGILLGLGSLVTMYRSEWWDVVQAHASWFMISAAVLFLVSIVTQTSVRPHSASAMSAAQAVPSPV